MNKIRLQYSAVSLDELNRLVVALKKVSPIIEVKEKEDETQAAWEWILPTVIILFIGKEVASGFFKEFGTGAAKRLKEGIKDAIEAARSKEITWVSLNSDFEKYNRKLNAGKKEEALEAYNAWQKTGHRSGLFTLTVEVEEGYEAEFIFPADITPAQMDNALNAVPAFIEVTKVRSREEFEIAKKLLGSKESSEEKNELFNRQMFRRTTHGCRFGFITQIEAWVEVHQIDHIETEKGRLMQKYIKHEVDRRVRKLRRADKKKLDGKKKS